jgi:hypothetical protein
MFANQSHNKIETVAHDDTNHHRHHHKDFHKSLKIAKGLFASFMLFTICWLVFHSLYLYKLSSSIQKLIKNDFSILLNYKYKNWLNSLMT